MKKNGRTLHEDVRLVKRGIGELNHILPGQLLWVFAKSILSAGIPYITVLLSASIIDVLTQGASKEKLVFLCSLTLLTTCLFSALKAYIESQVAVGFSHLFSAHELYLTDKSYRLPYELLEQNWVKQLREQVSGSIQVSGAGMASLYWDMDVVFTNTWRSLIAIILCGDFMTKLLSANAGSSSQIFHATKILLLMLVLIVCCSYLSCKMKSKRFDVNFEVFENGAKYNRYGEFYTLNYLADENAGLDTRIFLQDKIILKESYQKCYEPFAKGKQRELRAVSKYEGIRLLCSCLCGSVVYFVVGQEALQGVMGIGSILVTYTAVTALITALSEFAEIVTDLRNNNKHLLRFFQYMDLPEEEILDTASSDIPVAKSAMHQQPLSFEDISGIKCHTLTFDHVSFRYPESRGWVLEDINLTITAGEKLAIVGENGSGKTTLIKLLCRLYRPTVGKILLNGRDIWTYSYPEYIQCISTVFQDFSLFAFSLGENVAAASCYDPFLVKKALEKSGLESKLAQMPKGVQQALFHDYDEDGTDLSGGEAQKLAIARAIYKEAAIMILDEPTASLDPYAEYDIYRNFHNITSDKTVFSISHRLSSCRICDKIVVMDKGKAVQYGSHEELVKQPGKYSELWQAQAQYYS